MDAVGIQVLMCFMSEWRSNTYAKNKVLSHFIAQSV